MSDVRQDRGIEEDEALERLLSQAAPRPVPSRADEAAVRAAVHAEWSQVTSRRRRRRRSLVYAMAATILLGVFAVFNAFRPMPVDAIVVASIEKSDGAIYLLGQSAELARTEDLESVMAGQTIVTADNAALALAWSGGGSLRVDGNSRVLFASDDTLFLESGRIYFDSMPSPLLAATPVTGSGGVAVQTEHGRIRHIGTQFMAEAEPETLIVSVREGKVAIDGQYHDHTALAGEQVTFTGRQRPTVLSIGGSGESWSWVERTSPLVDMENRSLHEFLVWATRELGLELEFEGGAEAVARGAIQRGFVANEPSIALRQRLELAAFSYRIEGGVIYVTDSP